ncbi:DEAD/DEAH box helicase family protein [Coprococcus catus]|uniref:DEAD/DEAH box helicase family protein n=1 Tax=Coprococcus catus TaxID=116085 RepID=UPI003CFCAC73
MQILDHNLKAYKALIKSFKKANRACIVHPTGLGKSYIAYQLIADNPDSTFCHQPPNYRLIQSSKLLLS